MVDSAITIKILAHHNSFKITIALHYTIFSILLKLFTKLLKLTLYDTMQGSLTPRKIVAQTRAFEINKLIK